MIGRPPRRSRRALAASLALAVLSSLLAVFATASPAHADPGCVNSGAYVLFARGSGERLNGVRALSFQHYVMQALANEGVPSAWAELGNLDNHMGADGRPDDSGEYPAIPVDDWRHPPFGYFGSVSTGVDELVAHLNDRYAGNGPAGSESCTRETLVLGGYSQGANVIGDALRSGRLSQAAKNHIGYVALYGDPKFNVVQGSALYRSYGTGFQSTWWWVRGDDAGYHYAFNVWPLIVRNDGILGAASPYVPEEFKGRFGSWCAAADFVCSSNGNTAVHSTTYDGRWIAGSANEIAYEALLKRNQLDSGVSSASPVYLASATPYRYVAWLPNESMYFATTNALNPTPPPYILQVKRTLAPDGSTHEVYAATNSTVTEGWWHPGGDGLHTDEIINISQGNIVGFDKVNEPDGTTQSLYTAVSDGVWETWWRPGDGSHSNKIVTGLTGVRQVIAAPEVESADYTHRLYILASDGPYEAWWRDGGDGVHLTRLNNISGPVTMTKSRGPDGVDQLYVATPTWVYELWWWPGQGVHSSSIINITQGDIRSLDKGDNLPDGGQLLYTGTSTTAWQTYWNSSTAPSHGTIATGQAGAIQIEKDVYNGVHELYLATGDHVQEYWWNGPNSGGGELIRIAQNNITSFDKSNDGNFQQVYTASGDLVYETYWAAGVSPTSHVLFQVAR